MEVCFFGGLYHPPVNGASEGVAEWWRLFVGNEGKCDGLLLRVIGHRSLYEYSDEYISCFTLMGYRAVTGCC